MKIDSYVSVSVQKWMECAVTEVLMGRLNRGSDQPNALFVGGCVRNTLLGCPITDIDIATTLTPDEVEDVFRGTSYKVKPTGLDHGTVTVTIGPNYIYEVTTLRRDVSTDGRRATVAFTKDWDEDAARRDFTMNALYMDMEGNVYDPTGEGLTDLYLRVFRFIGDPLTRIQEDSLRILRFFRFHAQYGGGDLDKKSLDACCLYKEHVKDLSRERITQELSKLLKTDNEGRGTPSTALFTYGILSALPCIAYDPKIIYVTPGLSLTAKYLTLANFFYPSLESMEEWLIFTNDQKREMANILSAMGIMANLTPKAVKEAVYRTNTHASYQAVKLILARRGQYTVPGELNVALNFKKRKMKINGDDVISAGCWPGAVIGDVLREVEDWWIEKDFEPNRPACKEKMIEVIDRIKNNTEEGVVHGR